MDSIVYTAGNSEENNKKIDNCIDKQVITYQLASKISEIVPKTSEDSSKKNVNIELSTDKNSEGYKNSYYELQRYLFDNCASVKKIIGVIGYESNSGMSTNSKAIGFYNKGIIESNKENWQEALIDYEEAVKEDPNFAYAWEEVGICNRRLGHLDNALEAYQKSLKINPKAKMSLQNIPVVYSYMKKYREAITAYQNLDEQFPNDPEVYYGIGQIYYEHLQEYEKSLGYMCKAFNLYTKQKSPYRADAENIIVYIHNKMKDAGKLDKFNEILKQNNINPME